MRAPWRSRALLLGALLMLAEPPLEMGPFPTREMFPLYMVSQAYMPADPSPVGKGRWKASLDYIRANTFEFSDVLKTDWPQDVQGRVLVTKDLVQAHAGDFASLPTVFYFDMETVRTEFRVRYGLGPRTDVWLTVPVQSEEGGHLDRLIEGFHKLGFEQYGRNQVAQDQMTIVVIERGQLVFYSDEGVGAHFMDPTLGVNQVLHEGPNWLVSFQATVKPPLTRTYKVYRSGWDPTLALSARWQPSQAHVFYGGFGYVNRPPGSADYNQVLGAGFRSAWGAHATWEYRPGGRVRPFLQLLWQQGWVPAQPHQHLDRSSLQHDLGLHWEYRPGWVLTFRYLNNITHHENTADMGLGVSLSTRF